MSDPTGFTPRHWWYDATGVLRFAWSMWKKLRANRHKEHWTGDGDFEFYRKRIEDELHEMTAAYRAVVYQTPRGSRYQPKLDAILRRALMKEAADVGNFAMMIHERARLGL